MLTKKIFFLLQFLLILIRINSEKKESYNNSKFLNENFSKINILENKSKIDSFPLNNQDEIKSEKYESLKFLNNDLVEEIKESSINQKKITSEIRDFRLMQTNLTNEISTIISNSTINNQTLILKRSECNGDIDCSGNGLCFNLTKTCTCNKGFSTLYNNKTAMITKINNSNTTYYDYAGQKQCNYNQKNQLTAFMLSIFVGFGAEHFYLEKTGIGVAKLIFYFFCGFLNILYLVVYKCVPGGKKYVPFIHAYEALYLGCGVGYMLLWNIYDWVNIGFNDMLDGNNFKLTPWG